MPKRRRSIQDGVHSTLTLHFDGTAWTNLNINIAGNVYGVWGTAANNVYAVDDAGRVLHYNGTNWSAVYNQAQTSLWGIWGAAGNSVFAVGTDYATDLCRVLHFDGSNWSSMATGTDGQLYDVWGSGPDDVYAVGTDAAGTGTIILHYDGTAWSAMASSPAGPMNVVAGSAAADVYAGSHGGITLYHGTMHSAGSVQFDAAAYDANRFAGFLTITVTRNGGEDAQAVVAYAASDGTAAAGADYTAVSGTLTFEPGQTSRTFDVTLLSSATAGRTFTLTLSDPGSGTTLGDPHTAVATIVEDGPAPTLSIEPLPCAINALPFAVTLSREVAWPVIVDFATQDGTAVAGVHYTQAGDTLVIPPGQTIATINVDLIGDVEAATGKTLSVVLSNPVGASLDTAEATGEIRPYTQGKIRCGSGVGAGNLVVFYALCWAGLALIRHARRVVRGPAKP